MITTEGDGSARDEAPAQQQDSTVTTTRPATTTATSRPRPPATSAPRPWSAVTVDTSSATGVANASDYFSPTWNMGASQTEADASYDLITPDEATPLGAGSAELAAAIAAAQGNGKTAKGVWEDAVAAAARATAGGNPTTVSEALLGMARARGVDTSTSSSSPRGANTRSSGGSRSSSGSSSGGGYDGPMTSSNVQNASPASVRDLADQIGMEMLGRGVSQEEMERILKRIRVKEAKNPSVTTSLSGPTGTSSTSKQGVSDAERQDVIQKILAKNPEYGDYQKATTLMGMFNNALSERLQRG